MFFVQTLSENLSPVFSGKACRGRYSLPDQAAFDRCDFRATGAKFLGEESPLTVTLPPGSKAFYACQVRRHRERGQELVVDFSLFSKESMTQCRTGFMQIRDFCTRSSKRCFGMDFPDSKIVLGHFV